MSAFRGHDLSVRVALGATAAVSVAMLVEMSNAAAPVPPSPVAVAGASSPAATVPWGQGVHKIVVETRNAPNAGTDADVYIQLVGSSGLSGWRLLDDPSMDDFEAGQKSEYTINFGSAPPIGDLQSVQVALKFCDDEKCRKNSPNWFPNWVSVRRVDYPNTTVTVHNYAEVIAEWDSPKRRCVVMHVASQTSEGVEDC